jgi:hypothetical protein
MRLLNTSRLRSTRRGRTSRQYVCTVRVVGVSDPLARLLDDVTLGLLGQGVDEGLDVEHGGQLLLDSLLHDPPEGTFGCPVDHRIRGDDLVGGSMSPEAGLDVGG